LGHESSRLNPPDSQRYRPLLDPGEPSNSQLLCSGLRQRNVRVQVGERKICKCSCRRSFLLCEAKEPLFLRFGWQLKGLACSDSNKRETGAFELTNTNLLQLIQPGFPRRAHAVRCRGRLIRAYVVWQRPAEVKMSHWETRWSFSRLFHQQGQNLPTRLKQRSDSEQLRR